VEEKEGSDPSAAGKKSKTNVGDEFSGKKENEERGRGEKAKL